MVDGVTFLRHAFDSWAPLGGRIPCKFTRSTLWRGWQTVVLDAMIAVLQNIIPISLYWERLFQHPFAKLDLL